MKVANWKTCKKFSINNQQFYFSRHLDHIWFIIAHNKIVKIVKIYGIFFFTK